MADTGGTGAGDTGANNGNKDNNCIIETSDNKDLRLVKLIVQDTEEYTLCDEFRVIADNIKNQFKIPYNFQLHTNWPA